MPTAARILTTALAWFIGLTEADRTPGCGCLCKDGLHALNTWRTLAYVCVCEGRKTPDRLLEKMLLFHFKTPPEP